MLRIIDTGIAKAEENMRTDERLLKELSRFPEPILHLYSWKGDCLTYGHFIDPNEFINTKKASCLGLSMAKRPTGGGIVFHLCDLAFSVLLPSSHSFFSFNTLENYSFVNRLVVQALEPFLGRDARLSLLPSEYVAKDKQSERFCMAKPSKYDVMAEGRKVGGAAQRRTKEGFLHQGTISVAMLPRDYLEEVLLPDTFVVESMLENSFSLLGDSWTQEELGRSRESLCRNLVGVFQQVFS